MKIKTCRKLVKEGFSYQKKNGWLSETKRFLDYFEGRYWEDEHEGSRKYVVNTIFNYVNLMVPHLYYQDPYIKVKPKTKNIVLKKGDVEEVVPSWKPAELLENILNKELKSVKLEKEMRRVVQDVMIYGFGVMKVGYAAEFEQPVNNEKQDEDMDVPSIKDDSIFAYRVSPKDFGFDPSAKSPEEARYFIQKIVKPLDEVKKNDQYKNTKDLEGESDTETEELSGLLLDEKDKTGEFITLYEIEHLIENKVITYAKNGKSVLREVEKDDAYRGSHFVILKLAGDNDKFVGLPFIKMVEDQVLAKNEIFTRMVNHVDIFAGQVMAEEGALSEDQLQALEEGELGSVLITQNGAIAGGRVHKSGPLPLGQDVYSVFGVAGNIADDTLGIQDFQRAGSTKRKTAVEVSFEQADSTIRKEYFLSMVKEFTLDIVKRFVGLIQKHYDRERQIRIEGDSSIYYVDWTKDDIQGQYDFDYDIQSMKFMNQAKAQQIVNTLNILGAHAQKVPAFAQFLQTLDGEKLGKEIFAAMDMNYDSFKRRKDIAHLEMNPEMENRLFMAGKVVPDPRPMEPHLDHLNNYHLPLYEKTKDPMLLRHIEMHIFYDKVMKGEIGPEQIAQLNQQPLGQMPINEGGMNSMGLQPNAPAAPTMAEVVGGFNGNQ